MRENEVERLYEAHAAGMIAFLTYRTGDRALAEDLVADTFERALKARRGFDRRRGEEKAWLYTIALNRLRDHMRRRGAETRAVERVGATAAPAPSEDAGLTQVADRDSLTRALQRLSPEEREALALRFGADLTLREIAKATGESMSTVDGRVYRGLRKLRELLDRGQHGS